MGKRGPKPRDKVVPVAPKPIPRAPGHLDADASRHWNRLAGLINGSGLGSSLDEDAMTYYIAIWSRRRKAEVELAREGEVITAINGYRQLNPWYTVAKECLKELKSYLSEFGLSPKARARLVLPDVEEVDSKWEGFD